MGQQSNRIRFCHTFFPHIRLCTAHIHTPTTGAFACGKECFTPILRRAPHTSACSFYPNSYMLLTGSFNMRPFLSKHMLMPHQHLLRRPCPIHKTSPSAPRYLLDTKARQINRVHPLGLHPTTSFPPRVLPLLRKVNRRLKGQMVISKTAQQQPRLRWRNRRNRRTRPGRRLPDLAVHQPRARGHVRRSIRRGGLPARAAGRGQQQCRRRRSWQRVSSGRVGRRTRGGLEAVVWVDVEG